MYAQQQKKKKEKKAYKYQGPEQKLLMTHY